MSEIWRTQEGIKWTEHRKREGEKPIVTLLESELKHFSAFHVLSNDLIT